MKKPPIELTPEMEMKEGTNYREEIKDRLSNIMLDKDPFYLDRHTPKDLGETLVKANREKRR